MCGINLFDLFGRRDVGGCELFAETHRKCWGSYFRVSRPKCASQVFKGVGLP